MDKEGNQMAEQAGPQPLTGQFAPPGDKSVSHRLVLMSLLGRGRTELIGLADGEDVRSSLGAVETLGLAVDRRPGRVVVGPRPDRLLSGLTIDCGNSGTTMRLLMGLLAGQPGEFVLDGDESLRRRPMERVAGPLRLMGADIDCTDGRPPVTIRGKQLRGIDYELPVASAQVKSAVLLAGLQADGTTVVREPVPSRDHTEKLIDRMGGSIRKEGSAWIVEKSELALISSVETPGDPSSAAFFLCAAAIIPGSRGIGAARAADPDQDRVRPGPATHGRRRSHRRTGRRPRTLGDHNRSPRSGPDRR